MSYTFLIVCMIILEISSRIGPSPSVQDPGSRVILSGFRPIIHLSQPSKPSFRSIEIEDETYEIDEDTEDNVQDQIESSLDTDELDEVDEVDEVEENEELRGDSESLEDEILKPFEISSDPHMVGEVYRAALLKKFFSNRKKKKKDQEKMQVQQSTGKVCNCNDDQKLKPLALLPPGGYSTLLEYMFPPKENPNSTASEADLRPIKDTSSRNTSQIWTSATKGTSGGGDRFMKDSKNPAGAGAENGSQASFFEKFMKKTFAVPADPECICGGKMTTKKPSFVKFLHDSIQATRNKPMEPSVNHPIYGNYTIPYKTVYITKIRHGKPVKGGNKDEKDKNMMDKPKEKDKMKVSSTTEKTDKMTTEKNNMKAEQKAKLAAAKLAAKKNIAQTKQEAAIAIAQLKKKGIEEKKKAKADALKKKQEAKLKAVEAKAEKKKKLVKMKKSAVEKKLEGKKKVVEEKKKLVKIKAESKLSIAQDKKALAAIKAEIKKQAVQKKLEAKAQKLAAKQELLKKKATKKAMAAEAKKSAKTAKLQKKSQVKKAKLAAKGVGNTDKDGGGENEDEEAADDPMEPMDTMDKMPMNVKVEDLHFNEENKGYNYYGDSGSKKGKIKKSSGSKQKYKIIKKKKKNEVIKYEKFTPAAEYPVQNKFNVLDELKNLFWKNPNTSETIQMYAAVHYKK